MGGRKGGGEEGPTAGGGAAARADLAWGANGTPPPVAGWAAGAAPPSPPRTPPVERPTRGVWRRAPPAARPPLPVYVGALSHPDGAPAPPPPPHTVWGAPSHAPEGLFFFILRNAVGESLLCAGSQCGGRPECVLTACMDLYLHSPCLSFFLCTVCLFFLLPSSLCDTDAGRRRSPPVAASAGQSADSWQWQSGGSGWWVSVHSASERSRAEARQRVSQSAPAAGEHWLRLGVGGGGGRWGGGGGA